MDGGAPDTWTSWASPDFFQPYCVSCHSAGQSGDPAGSGLDFTTYAGVPANASLIECGVALAQDPSWGCGSFPPPGQFPIGGGPAPTAGERARLVAWIDAGLPE